jgi:hypothetical protein
LNGRENLKDREKRRDCSKEPQNVNGKELKENIRMVKRKSSANILTGNYKKV